jgi:hypothetical protein
MAVHDEVGLESQHRNKACALGGTGSSRGKGGQALPQKEEGGVQLAEFGMAFKIEEPLLR